MPQAACQGCAADADNEADGMLVSITDVAPYYCTGHIRLNHDGCKSTGLQHALIGVMLLASLCYFACWVFCIYRSKSALNSKPYSDFKVANLLIRLQVGSLNCHPTCWALPASRTSVSPTAIQLAFPSSPAFNHKFVVSRQASSSSIQGVYSWCFLI